MPNYIDDDTALPATRVDRRPVPPGHDEREFDDAAYHNAILQFCEDARDAIQRNTGAALGDDQGSTAVDYTTTYTDPDMATAGVLYWRGNDNQGSTLRSMNPSTLAVGSIRYFINPSTSGIDVGTVTLKHEDTTGTTATHRFCCPGAADYQVPIFGVTILIRGYNETGGERWLVVGQNGHAKKALIQSLQLYPNLQVGTPGSPVSGSLNNYNPTGQTPFESSPGVPSTLGIAGSNLTGKDHTFWRMFVHANGATLTGVYGQAENGEVSDFGRIHVLKNYGPGTLTIAHRSSSSDSANQIFCPNQRDLIVPADGAVWLIKPFYGAPDPGVTVSWHVLGAAFSNEVFPSVTTTARTTTRQITLATKDTPAQLGKHTTITNDWNPGTGSVAAANTHNDGSIVAGLVPAAPSTPGEIRYVLNVGTGPLALLNETASSTEEYRFTMPNGRPCVLPTRCSMGFRYDESSRWNALDSRDPEIPFSVSITPAALAASNINNYAPTDATTSWPGRLAKVWRIQGNVGTVLTGVDATPTGLPQFVHGDRILLINYSAGMTIAHQSASSDAGNKITCPPGGASNPDYILLTGAAVWLIYDALGATWILEGTRL